MIGKSVFATETNQSMRIVFDTIPSPALILDSDARIQAYNRAAETLLPDVLQPEVAEIQVLGTQFGDALGCVHTDGQIRGCGHGPLCQVCVVRVSLKEAITGNVVVRKRMHLRFLVGGEIVQYYGLITSSPFAVGGLQYGLLIIEDIGIIAELQRVIPLCSDCGKVRDKDNRWVSFESYFKDTWDVDFSHGLCPSCVEHRAPHLDHPGRRHIQTAKLSGS